MTKKIIVSVIASFVVSFGLLIGLILFDQNYLPNEQIVKEHEFYTKKFSLENNLIFLMGSSHDDVFGIKNISFILYL